MIANVTPAVTPDRAKHDIYGIILDIFWPIQDAFVAKGPLGDVVIPSWALITLLRII